MKRVAILLIICIVLIVGLTQFLSSSSNYIEKVKVEREELLSFMQRSNNSPFEGLEKPKGLFFFDIDEEYRVFAKVKKSQGNKLLTIQKTLGDKVVYLRVSKLEFKIKGKEFELSVYQNEQNPNDILLPFTDRTNGHETYETGRYLHVKNTVLNRNEIELDFNLATNPYCAYNVEYSCPIPPAENHLDMAIKAGEKKYEK